MCSTPKPKRSSQRKALTSSTSILAAMNSTQRQAFAERANEASERRASQLSYSKEMNQKIYSSTKHSQLRAHPHGVKKTWLYWILSASLTDVMQKIIKHK